MLIHNFALLRWNTKEVTHLLDFVRTLKVANPRTNKSGLQIPPLQRQFYLETRNINDKQEMQDVPNIE